MFYFMFSKDSYEDYEVEGFYVCDHEVTENEWKDFVKQQNRLIKVEEEKAAVAYGLSSGMGHKVKGNGSIAPVYGPGYYNSQEHKDYLEQRSALFPLKLFIELHNMTKLEHTEFWEG